ncbi:uncharacterized protein LOC117807495 [Notolabrus celidotus]|uniref:uncharacterized protein LOC117807495 n=1 Tax=Notolabrus celidotus TaxID=1203425 RepID=UPI00148F9437|nr:uncharacterized protein LOC117807495 [Notolabrus celidotus]
MLGFYLLWILLCRAYGVLQYADPGQIVTLQCFFDSSSNYLSWYKQVAGEQPQLITSFYKHFLDAYHFHNQFKDDNRFSVQTGEGAFHLIISEVRDSDSALYYCGHTSITITEFQEGIHLVLKESSVLSFIMQPTANSVTPGGSVTLNCTVHTGSCDGEHSVYWFKDSEESQPGLIYTSGGKKDQCERKPDSQTHTCVYNLPMKNLNLSHAGTYYCAVVSCGHVLFGDGTKVALKYEVDFLSGAVTLTTMSVVLLAVSVCMMIKRNSCRSADSQATLPAPSVTNAEVSQNTPTLYYAAVSVNLTDSSVRQRDQTWSECVYFSLKQ